MATTSQSNKSNHEGVSCDGCMAPNFAGNRYKCLRCYDFDLCHACYVARRYNPPIPSDGLANHHNDSHPVLCILSQRDFELLYSDDPTKNYSNCKIAVITCPYCGQTGFSHTAFFEHLQRDHHEPPPNLNVNCPLCITCPEFDANREVENLYNHWTNTHTTFEATATMQRDNSRASRRPMLGARRAPRQPTGLERRANPTQRTLQRLYAEVLGDNGVPGAGVGTAVQQLYNGLGVLPWTSELVDVDDMFRMATLNRNLPNLPTGFNAPTEGMRITQLPTGGASAASVLIPTFRSAATARAQTSANNEYAAPSSSRQHNNTRNPAITSVQVIRSLGATSIYPSVQESIGEERNIIQNLVFDIEDEDDSSFDEANDEQEFESAEESAIDEMGIEAAYSDESPNAGVPIDDAPRLLLNNSKLISAEHSRVQDEKRSKQMGGEFIWESETDESEIEHDELVDSSEAGKSSTKDPQSSRSSSDENFDGINPLLELRKTCSDSEWATVVHAAFEEEHPEHEDRLDTPKAHLASSQSSDFRDPQCWLTVQIDTSQLQFTATPQHWRDTRFLRQKKMNRELSVVSDIERVIEQNEVAEAILRSALPIPLSGRELDSTSVSIRNALSKLDLWSEIDKVENHVKLKNQEDNVESMHQLLQNEALIVSRAQETTITPPPEITQSSHEDD